MRSTILLAWLLWLTVFTFAAATAHAASGWQPSHLGVRYGYSVTSHEHAFDQVELFALWPLFGGRTAGPLALDLEGFAGTLWSPRKTGFIGGAGPVLRFFPAFPLSLEGGIRVAWLSEYDFREYPYTDFGGPVQFVSHGGVIFRPASHLEVSGRFQHMSNGELYEENSGLNMLMAGVAWRF